jgi:uncharacterized protein YgiB involved in biofilm formation
MKKSYADTCLERANRAHHELYKITADRRKFQMSIPPQEDDTDMILEQSLDDCEEAARRLKKACEALRNCGSRTCHEKADELEAMPEEKK